MKSILHLSKLLLLVGSLFIAISCTQETSSKTKGSAVSDNYQSYSKDRLNLKHPAHWSLVYDDDYALLANRDISFETPKHSKISVLIYDKSTVDGSEVVYSLISSIKPSTDKNIQDFKQAPIQISGYKGYRLTWKNTLLGSTNVEMTILKSGVSAKPVFAVFKFQGQDIENETANLIPFVKNISFQ